MVLVLGNKTCTRAQVLLSTYYIYKLLYSRFTALSYECFICTYNYFNISQSKCLDKMVTFLSSNICIFSIGCTTDQGTRITKSIMSRQQITPYRCRSRICWKFGCNNTSSDFRTRIKLQNSHWSLNIQQYDLQLLLHYIRVLFLIWVFVL